MRQHSAQLHRPVVKPQDSIGCHVDMSRQADRCHDSKWLARNFGIPNVH